MRHSLQAAIALAVIAAAGILVRVQPRESATIFTTDGRLTTRFTPIYLRPLALTDGKCQVITIGGRPAFDEAVTVRTATYDELSARARFTYTPPARIASGTDWCDELRKDVTSILGHAPVSADELLANRRVANDQIERALADELQRFVSAPQDVSVRIDLPEHFERVRNVPEIASAAKKARPVIFLGLDGADWQLLDGYIASGAMPNLRRLVTSGASGVLETEHPPLSPIVWTTMMTGVGPLDHGILDFTRFNPKTQEKEPITSDERRAPAIWNMLTAGGKSVAVLGLWGTYAAEPVHGIDVSDRLFSFLYSERERPPGAVYPPARESWGEVGLGESERAIDLARMRAYLPSLTEAEFAALTKSTNPYADPPAALHRILVQTDVYRRLATSVLQTRVPDMTIAYFEGADSIGHVFAPFAPPKQPSVSQSDYDRYHDVPEHFFRDLDAILGEFIGIAERSGAAIMIASDHGFQWREGRPTDISSTATATAAKWHRNEGIYVLWGPGIAATSGHALRGGVRQVCATLLSLAGMPSAAKGTAPLPGAPAANPPADYARFFTPAPPPPAAQPTRGSDEEIAKLRALGYIGSNESPRSAVAGNDTRTAGAWNNAGLILRQEHRTDEALAAFRRAEAIDPKYASAMWNESETLFDAGRDLDRSDRLLVAAMKGGLNDASRFVITRAIGYQRSGRAARALQLLDAAVAASSADGELRMFRGRYRMDAHDCRGALDDFLAAETSRPGDALTFASAGLAQLCLGDPAAARESFRRSLAIDPNQPQLQQLLAGS